MTKKQFIEELSLLDDFESKAAAERAYSRFVGIIKEQLLSGNQVDLSGFMSFSTRVQKGRTGKVPGTNDTYSAADKVIPAAKFTAPFKRAIAEGK